LLDQGVDINRTDERRLDDGLSLAFGETDDSLHLLNNVAADGNIYLFDHLVGKGADASRGLALHTASNCQDPEKSRAMVCHLLDKHNMDMDINDETFRDMIHAAHDEGSPLYSSVIHRNLAVIQELLKRGASFNDPAAWLVEYAVMADGFLPALEPLLRAGVDPTEALLSSVDSINLEATKICMEFGADPTPTLPETLEREKSRAASVAQYAAYHERSPDPGYVKHEDVVAEEKAAVGNIRLIIDLLRRAIESDTASHSVIP
jgi:hypothetical protein